MFWSDTGGGAAGSARIERAAMDGLGRSVPLRGKQLVAPTGLALDAAGTTIYWCDEKLGKARHADDTSNVVCLTASVLVLPILNPDATCYVALR